ncbi:MAG TPA: helix-turn-helix domain-containing protein [Chloroflexota bacterium]
MFDLLLEDMATQIAERVIARIDAHLEARSSRTEPDAYRVDEAAAQLGLSEREVKRRIASGELASLKVGRARLIPRGAIATFLGKDGSASRIRRATG